MENHLVTQYGIEIALVVLILVQIIKLLINQLGKKKNGEVDKLVKTHLQPCHEKVVEVHNMLSEKDQEGVLKIYRRPSFDEAIIKMAEGLGKIGKILENQELEQKNMNKDIQSNKKTLERIEKTLNE